MWYLYFIYHFDEIDDANLSILSNRIKNFKKVHQSDIGSQNYIDFKLARLAPIRKYIKIIDSIINSECDDLYDLLIDLECFISKYIYPMYQHLDMI